MVPMHLSLAQRDQIGQRIPYSPQGQQVQRQEGQSRSQKMYLSNHSAVFIKKNPKITKFKIRKGRYFYTFKAEKPNVIQAIENGLGKDVEKIEIKKRRVAVKKGKK